jgi:replicative DNA helicase
MSQKIPGKLKVITPKVMNGIMGVNALRSFVEKEEIDVLCIDQHSLLEDDRNARDPVVRAANISKDLKRLQVLKRIPIIAVSQANRAIADDGKMGLENIAQSDRIGQDSTIVLGLDQKDGVLSVHLLKSRDSERGNTLKYALDFDKGIYTFIPNESDGGAEDRYQDVKDRYNTDSDYGSDEF